MASVNARIGWKALTAAEYQPQGFTFLSTPNIKGREIDFDNVNYITEFRYQESPELKLREGDVLLAKDGNTLGIVNLVKYLPRPATVNGSIAVIRPTGIDGAFLRYVLASRVTQAAINMLKGGMGVPHLFQWDINRLPVPVPPLEEQRRIADFLDVETARIDRLTQLRSRQAGLLEERFGLALDKAFENATYEPTRLKYLLAVKPRYGVLVPQYSDSGVRFIRVNDLLDLAGRADSLAKIPDELSSQYARTVTRPGDVLLSVVGTMGRSAVVPPQLAGANVARAVASLRTRHEVSPELLATWLTTPSFLRQASDVTGSDTAQPTLGMEDLSNFRLSWPVDERGRDELLLVTSTIRRHQRELTGVLEVQRRVLTERRQALITAAVTGQFDVSTASGRNVTDGVNA
ncbi:type I restriction-modification system specificity subunit [Streptomyces sp. Mg1]|nr:type I restriction-modification system specificity subunit [Streptomyces sp. Mg1]EDX23636.1 type I restriction-modification system specificity subunit [Streptomyces sp. Mg1]